MHIQKKIVAAAICLVSACALLVASLIMLSGAQRDERNTDTLVRVTRLRNALSLYYLSVNTYPQPEQSRLIMGSDQAQCLATSARGFERTCAGQVARTVVLAGIPRGILGASDIVYSHSEGDYSLIFELDGSWRALRDTNKDGKTQCRATSTTLVCQ